MRVSDSVPALLSGVSQQDARLRLPSHVQDSLNGIPHPVHGYCKRPGTWYAGALSGYARAAWLYPGLSESDRWLVVLETNQPAAPQVRLRVYRIVDDVNGVSLVEETATISAAAQAYIAANLTAVTAVEGALRGVFVDSKLILTNRTVVPALLQIPLPPPWDGSAGGPLPPFTFEYWSPNTVVIWVRGAAYSTDFSVKLDQESTTVTVTATTSSTAVVGGAVGFTAVNVENIAERLRVLLLAQTTVPVTVTRSENILIVQPNTTVPLPLAGRLTATTTDGAASALMTSVRNQVTRFSDLPPRSYDGHIARIASNADSQASAYYVKFNTDADAPIGVGVWEECVDPTNNIAFDPATMPISVTRQSDGTFDIDTLPWTQKAAGDNEICPAPSIVGRPITDIFLWRNRLGFLTPTTVVLSRSGKYYELWRQTATQLVDDDRIDITINHPQLSYLNAATPFDETVALLGDAAQFVLEAGEVLTTRSIAARFKTAEALSPALPAFSIKSAVYAFGTDRKSVVEFYRDSNTASLESVPVTGHVPRLIENAVGSALAPAANSCVIWSRDGDGYASRDLVYYRWLFDGPANKVQAAWQPWRMSGGVVWAVGDAQRLFFIIEQRDSNGALLEQRLEVLDLDESTIQPREYTMETVRLDCRVPASRAVEDPDDVYTLPYIPAEGESATAVTPAGRLYQGVVSETLTSTTKVTINGAGDPSASEGVIFGIPFEWFVTPSPIFVRTQGTTGLKPVTTGRLQLTNMKLKYINTTYFEAVISTPYRDDLVQTVETFDIGASSISVGDPLLTGGDISINARGRADTLTVTIRNNTHLCSSVVGFDWEGSIFQTTQRL